jgi:hypothetical protein
MPPPLPRSFVWAVVPAMVGFVVFAFALDCYMLLYHRSQVLAAVALEIKRQVRTTQSGARLRACGGGVG